MTFGDLVRAGRQAAGLTLVEVGQRIGCDHARLSRIEGGTGRPTAEQAAALIRELRLDEGAALAALDRRADPDSTTTAPTEAA